MRNGRAGSWSEDLQATAHAGEAPAVHMLGPYLGRADFLGGFLVGLGLAAQAAAEFAGGARIAETGVDRRQARGRGEQHELAGEFGAGGFAFVDLDRLA